MEEEVKNQGTEAQEEKIELTELELKVLKDNINGDFFPPDRSDEEKAALHRVIDMADKLMEKLDAKDELGTNLMAWFLNKYESQKN